jgi:N-acetylglucosamine-6-phosphate deacetylase
VAAASANPAALLGASDRGEIAAGRRADLVQLDDDLAVERVMRGGAWQA